MLCLQGLPVRPQPAASCLLLGAALLLPGSSLAGSVTIPWWGVDSYARCVIRQIDKKTGAQHVAAIENNCRAAFPTPSRRSLFGPRSADSCYQRNKEKASHRQAAAALYGACQDYFRRG